MTARTFATLVGTVGFAAGVTACGGSFATASCGAARRIPLAPAGVYVSEDVANGYVAYAAALAGAGAWSPDATYGAHWCPSRVGNDAQPFRPYVSRGHWTTAEVAEYGAAPGTPYWAPSEDAAPWAEITAHHGWWIDLRDGPSEPSRWCWVPGMEETPARVVWRADGDFVGWAPEPPIWIDDGDDDPALAFEWTFELLGTLLEDAIDGYVLTGDAAAGAAQATSSEGSAGQPGPALSRRAPARPVVNAARQGLLATVRAQPSVAPASAASPASPRAASPSSGAVERRPDLDAPSSLIVAIRLPPASVLLLLTQPPASDLGALGGYGSALAARGLAGPGPFAGASPSGSHVSPAWSASRTGSASALRASRVLEGNRSVGSSSSSSSHSGSSGSGHASLSSTSGWHR